MYQLKISAYIKSIFLSGFLMLILGTDTTFAQNLALNKPYTLSETPNYTHSAPSTDKTSLTDGIKTNKGTYWTQKTTVGWNKKTSVRINLDIKQVQPIETITFGTGAGQSDVYFPQNVYVFISEDGKKYEYAGDMMSAPNLPDTTYTGYRKATFELNAINRKARYIILEAIPRNNYLFCDEIEVIKGGKIEKNRSEIKFDIADYNKARDCIKTEEHQRKNLSKVLDSMPEDIKKSMEIKSTDVTTQSPVILREEIGKGLGSYLNKRFKSSWTIESVNPWMDFNPFYQPISPKNALDYQFHLPLEGVQYGAFALTNTETKPLELSIQLQKNNQPSVEITLFEVRQVSVKEGDMVSDPILPLGNQLKIEPGITKTVFFKISGVKIGDFTHKLSVSGKNKTVAIHINAQVVQLKNLDKKSSLSANVWAYFNRPILQQRPSIIGNDLRQHHVNTIVVPTAMLPLINNNDYSKTTNYLVQAGKFDKVLLYNSYVWADRKNGYKGGQFMSSEWKQYFIKWYAGIQQALKKLGYSEEQIYFYPYDEIRDANEIKDFIKLIQWAKQAVKGIQFYATLSYEDPIQQLTPLLDIVQLHHEKDRMITLPKHHAEIWTYSGSAPLRAKSPYTYFRLMAWEAFANGYKGIGFWNYSTNDKDYPVDRLLLNPATDYSVIYTGEGDRIISTRRWEAFRLGIEDSDILMAYSKKYGIQKAKEIAQEVLANPSDLNRADFYRTKMLREL